MGKVPEIQEYPHNSFEMSSEIQEFLDHGKLLTKESHGSWWKVTEPLPHGFVELVYILDPAQAKKAHSPVLGWSLGSPSVEITPRDFPLGVCPLRRLYPFCKRSSRKVKPTSSN